MIPSLFYALFFFIPLILFPYSSELFEFNKIIAVYFFTTLVVATWIFRCLAAKKFLFRRTILDIPILTFLVTLIISSIFSIDVRTSILGYYSRFNGGLSSYVSYSLLYWAYVSNMDAEKTRRSIFVLFGSAIFVCLYGILQHFGIDKNIWVQDVQNRIFSTLGQPNWLAAWIVALIPLTWAFGLNEKLKMKSLRFWLWLGMSVLLFTTLLFTKSRSGLLGFGVSYLMFWSTAFYNHRNKILKEFLIFTFSLLLLTFVIGTPFTNKVIAAPETGGTESGEIRKIVWKGAIDLWHKYPVLGTGPETFAYSYYETRPKEHNLVSEWDFLYNKAHNEYLNFAATTGIFGLGAYLLLIASIIWQIVKRSVKSYRDPSFLIYQSLLAGFASILVTNFFGFSVVPVALLFFMFPAFATTLTIENAEDKILSVKNFGAKGKVFLFLLPLFVLYLFLVIIRYWYADFLYAKGTVYNEAEEYDLARPFLVKAINLSPNEAIFWGGLSRATLGLVQNRPDLAETAISESQKAISLSPRNLSLQRNLASVFISLAAINPNYLLQAKRVTDAAIIYAPTDAKLYYNSALTTYRLGRTEEALTIFDKTIELKSNYKNARFAKALVLIELGRSQEAKQELGYILEKIDPNDNLARQELEKL